MPVTHKTDQYDYTIKNKPNHIDKSHDSRVIYAISTVVYTCTCTIEVEVLVALNSMPMLEFLHGLRWERTESRLIGIDAWWRHKPPDFMVDISRHCMLVAVMWWCQSEKMISYHNLVIGFALAAVHCNTTHTMTHKIIIFNQQKRAPGGSIAGQPYPPTLYQELQRRLNRLSWITLKNPEANASIWWQVHSNLVCTHTCMHVHVYIYLSVGGSSLMTSQTGHSDCLEDRKIATPSVLTIKDILLQSFKKTCFLYSTPSYTSDTPGALFTRAA